MKEIFEKKGSTKVTEPKKSIQKKVTASKKEK